eukprot:scaffold81472_cov20-Tisochrysis_lutea.AAC.1
MHRGMGLEILLTKLRYAVSTGLVTHKLQIIAMSATMGGLEGMCNWLDAVGCAVLCCVLCSCYNSSAFAFGSYLLFDYVRVRPLKMSQPPTLGVVTAPWLCAMLLSTKQSVSPGSVL